MEKMQDTLSKVGEWSASNKYLVAIKNAFEKYMPLIIIGAIAVLWTNVIVNDQTGLGALWKPIMNLSFLNPAFNAINFCTMGIIALGITFLVGYELAKNYKFSPSFCGFLSVVAWVSMLNTTQTIVNVEKETVSVSGLFSGVLGTDGLFTGMIIAIVTVELFRALYSIDWLKIKLPDQVPEGVARSFEYLLPAFVLLLITSMLSLVIQNVSGGYINDLIFKVIQKPLTYVGGSLPGILCLTLISGLFWSVGLHGDNMIAGVIQPITLTLMLENTTAVEAGKAATNIVNWSFYRTFLATGGTGMVLGLTLAIFLVSKRADNRAIAKVAIIPNLFNIGEINMFGVPVVLNPFLIIPFILAPIVSITFGYIMTYIGFCPVMYVTMPWTMPPFLMGFLAAGGSIMAGITQLLAIALSVLIYIPFVKMYEKNQLDQTKQ
mgnify:FL=1